jgi:tetratricopeptide (TPR) repeat protein
LTTIEDITINMSPGFFYAARRPRFVLVLALALALGLAGWTAGEALDAPRWGKGLAAVLSLAATFVIEPLLGRTQWAAGVAASRRAAAPEAVGGSLPDVADLSLEQLRVHPPIAQFPYYERASFGEALDQLRSKRKLLIVGRSMSGKTRLASETVKRLYPSFKLWRPTDGAAVARLLADGSSVKRTVIWLDDLERFVGAGGLHLAHLDALWERSNVIVATVRGGVLDQMTDAMPGRPTGADLIPWFGPPVWLTPWTEAEVTDALATSRKELPRQSVIEHGLSGYLGGAPLLLRKLNIARSEDSAAYAVLQAVADLAMCGLAGGISRSNVPRALLLRHRSLSDKEIADAISWCTEPIAGSLTVLNRDADHDQLSLPDPILERFEDAEELRVPVEAWTLAMDLASDTELVSIGERAYDDGLLDVALAAWRRSSTVEAAYNLGLALQELEDQSAWEEAERVLRRVTVDDTYPLALTSLGIVLEKLAGGTESYVAEAHALYRRAAEHDEPVAVFNAGACAMRAKEYGWEEEAERYLRRAHDLGHDLAPSRLAQLLHDVGRIREAEAMLEVAATGEHPEPDDVAQFGELLLDRGEDVRGEVYLERSVSAGSDRGRLALAQLIAQRNLPAELTRASQLLDAIEEVDRAPGLQALKALVLNQRRLFNAARSVLEDGHQAGDARCTVELASFLVSTAQEELGRERIPLQLQDIPEEAIQLLTSLTGPDQTMGRFYLGTIYMDVGEVDLAIGSLEIAASGSGDIAQDAKAQLAAALLARGRSQDVATAIELLTGVLGGPNHFSSAQQASLLNNLGAAYRDAGDMANAELRLGEAARRGSVSAMRNIAALLEHEGRWWHRWRARRWYRRADVAAEAVLADEEPSARYEMRAFKALVHEPNLGTRRSLGSGKLYRRKLQVRVGPMRRRSSLGPNSIWAVCRRCRLPFEVPSGAFIVVPPESVANFPEVAQGTAGPCPYCWDRFPVPRRGDALLVLSQEGSKIRVGGNTSRNFRAIMTIGTDLATGRLSASEASDWFERSVLPWACVAELMQASSSDEHASGLLAAAVRLAGPELVTDDAPTPDAEEVFREVVAYLLEGYRRWNAIPALEFPVVNAVWANLDDDHEMP